MRVNPDHLNPLRLLRLLAITVSVLALSDSMLPVRAKAAEPAASGPRAELHDTSNVEVLSVELEAPSPQSSGDQHLNLIRGLIRIRRPGDRPFELKFNLYQSTWGISHPLMVVLPPIVGSTLIDRETSRTLAFENVDALQIDIDDVFTTGKDLAYVERYFQNWLLSVRMLVKHLTSHREFAIDRSRVGVFGLSMGGVLAATLVGLGDEFTHGYILAGGGNFGRIMARTNQSKLLKFRSYLMESGQATEETLTSVFSEALTFDPLRFADRVPEKNKKVFFVIPREDETIPPEAQWQLWSAMGRPPYEEITYYSHIGTIIRWFIKDRYRLLDFIRS